MYICIQLTECTDPDVDVVGGRIPSPDIYPHTANIFLILELEDRVHYGVFFLMGIRYGLFNGLIQESHQNCDS